MDFSSAELTFLLVPLSRGYLHSKEDLAKNKVPEYTILEPLSVAFMSHNRDFAPLGHKVEIPFISFPKPWLKEWLGVPPCLLSKVTSIKPSCSIAVQRKMLHLQEYAVIGP